MVSHKAWGEGFNSENFTPSLNGHTGILWETPHILPHRSFALASTLSYATRPIEFGDGKTERLKLTDKLLVNHIGFSYGAYKWIQIGTNLPLVIFANPNSAEGYLRNVQARDREYFFLGDLAVQAKFAFPRFIPVLDATITTSIVFPTGSREALTTDDSMKFTVELPISMTFASHSIETFFTPGIAKWESEDRIYAYTNDAAPVSKILQKSDSLLLSAGGRYWISGTAQSFAPKTFVVDAGVRGDFADSKISFTNPESPAEWSMGIGYFATRSLSFHSAFGSGLGVGAGAPMSRIVAGVRYTALPLATETSDAPLKSMLSSSAYTEKELETILEQARAEPIPPSLSYDEDIVLRLKVNGEIIDIGGIHFDSNSAQLSKHTKSTIELLFHELKRIHPSSIRIEGHTDSVGSYNYNLVLSKRRADAVKKELVRLGENPDIVDAEGFSYRYPLASNGTSEGRKQNRRIEVSVDGESFRKLHYTREEEELMLEWIAPGGKKPTP
jgi:outer membrane protein OmpA-like peptidoglycan-associated protein